MIRFFLGFGFDLLFLLLYLCILLECLAAESSGHEPNPVALLLQRRKLPVVPALLDTER